jgi:hypothetical protein
MLLKVARPMKSSHFKLQQDNLLIFNFRQPLLQFIIATVAVSCSQVNSESSSRQLYKFEPFITNQISFNLKDWEGNYVRYKYSNYDSVLICWTTSNVEFKLFKFPDFNLINNNSFVSLTKVNRIKDLELNNDTLYIVGIENQLARHSLISGLQEIYGDTLAICFNQCRYYATKLFPMIIEDNYVYLRYSTNLHSNFLIDSIQQTHFFSYPLEIRLDLGKNEALCLGRYPSKYLREEIDFYNWPPARQRLLGQSIYSFPHIDSLYFENDQIGTKGVSSRKSILSLKKHVPIDNTKIGNFDYISEYGLVNDWYGDLIADENRNLLYSIFHPGVETSKDRRLSHSDIAFSILIFNHKLEFIKEVYFHPGIYNSEIHFVTPHGLAIQKINNVNPEIRQFDIFDFTKENIESLNKIPNQYISEKIKINFSDYLRKVIKVKETENEILIVSNFGCFSCIKNLLIKTSEINFDKFSFVVDVSLLREKDINDFMNNQRSVYIDHSGQLNSYKVIKGSLTYIQLNGNSVLKIDPYFDPNQNH